MPATRDRRRKFPCTYPGCGGVYSGKKYLGRHMRRMNHIVPEWTCSWKQQCKKAFYSFEDLERHCDEDHMKQAYSPIPSMDIKFNSGYPCVHRDCRAVLRHEKAFHKHLEIFHGPRKHQCPHCDERFPRKDYVRKHIWNNKCKKRNISLTQPSCSSSAISTSSAGPFTSQDNESQSLATTSSSSLFPRYPSTNDEEDQADDEDKDEDMDDDEDSAQDLEQDQNTEEEGDDADGDVAHGDRRFKCKSAGCNHAFKTRAGLRCHRLTVHEQFRYDCPHQDCDRSYTQTPALNAHIAKYHQEDDH